MFYAIRSGMCSSLGGLMAILFQQGVAERWLNAKVPSLGLQLSILGWNLPDGRKRMHKHRRKLFQNGFMFLFLQICD